MSGQENQPIGFVQISIAQMQHSRSERIEDVLRRIGPFGGNGAVANMVDKFYAAKALNKLLDKYFKVSKRLNAWKWGHVAIVRSQGRRKPLSAGFLTWFHWLQFLGL